MRVWHLVNPLAAVGIMHPQLAAAAADDQHFVAACKGGGCEEGALVAQNVAGAEAAVDKTAVKQRAACKRVCCVCWGLTASVCRASSCVFR